MTAQDWTILITAGAGAIASILTLFFRWLDGRRKAEQEQERLTLEMEQAQQRLEWEAKERTAESDHRRKMEELQIAALRQGGLAAKAAKKAQEAAVVSAQAVTQKIDESIEERRSQVKALETKIEENTKVNEQAIETANGFNGKLVQLSAAVATQKDPT